MSATKLKRRMANGGSYTVAQVTAITNVPQKAVNQYLDRDLASLGIAIIGAGFRSVRPEGLLVVRLIHELVNTLVNDKRTELARKLLAKPNAKSIPLDDGKIEVSIAPARALVARGLKAFNGSQAMVSVDPAILGGEPCLKGTRQSVYTIADLLAESGRDELLLAYPNLSDAQIEAARIYALGTPRRGRPKNVEDVLARAKAKPRRTRSVDIE